MESMTDWAFSCPISVFLSRGLDFCIGPFQNENHENHGNLKKRKLERRQTKEARGTYVGSSPPRFGGGCARYCELCERSCYHA